MSWLPKWFAYLALLLAWPWLLLHPKLRHGIKARLGYHPASVRALAANQTLRVWVHGASAGDILALVPTVRALQQLEARLCVLATATTNSGYQMAQRFGDVFAAVSYCPYDIPAAVHRTLAAFAPALLILEYTELWPNLLAGAHQQHVPVVLHNGRLHPHKLRRYRLLFRLIGNLLRPLHGLLMRHRDEAARAVALGAVAERVFVTGNTKFDDVVGNAADAAAANCWAAALPWPATAPVWVVGSSHAGEEQQLLRVFGQLRRQYPHLCLLMAPRYIERSRRLMIQAQRLGWSVCLHSQAAAATHKAVDVVILDSIGQLHLAYSMATLVFVGGSLVAHGGHNILEPAACGKAVVFGPHMSNFTEEVSLLHNHGGIQAANPQQLAPILQQLLDNTAERLCLGALAQARVHSSRGAAKRNAALLFSWLHGAQPSQPSTKGSKQTLPPAGLRSLP